MARKSIEQRIAELDERKKTLKARLGKQERKTSGAEHISARDLINRDEIMRLPASQMILLRQGQRPAIAAKLRYFDDPEFGGLYGPP